MQRGRAGASQDGDNSQTSGQVPVTTAATAVVVSSTAIPTSLQQIIMASPSGISSATAQASMNRPHILANMMELSQANSSQVVGNITGSQLSQPVSVTLSSGPVKLQTTSSGSVPSMSTVVSPSGGTIHHMGHSPSRGSIPPLANPNQHQLLQSVMNVQQLHQPGATPTSPTATRRPSITTSPATSPRAHGIPPCSPLLGGYAPLAFSNRTSPVTSPARKRKKLEEKAASTPELAMYRKLICDKKLHMLSELKESYREQLTELFFLQNGGNIMDYYAWKKRPTPQLVQFLKSGSLDCDDEEVGQEKKINDEVKVITATGGGTMPISTPVAISTTLPPAVSAIQQQTASQDPSKKLGGRHGMVFGHVQQPGSSPVAAVIPETANPITPTPVSSISDVSLVSTPQSGVTTPISGHSSQLAMMMAAQTPTSTIASPKTTVASSGATTSVTSSLTMVTKTSKGASTPITAQQLARHSVLDLGSQEAIVERAKQEAQVMQRIAELRKEGMWTSRRLPKVQEPPRNKAHWDYLLEEMQWLAADFTQERKWKKAGAKKIARMITKYHQELHQKEMRAEKEEFQKVKRIASNMAKMVREFWNNIEKVVQYKQQSRLEEKRKRAMDLHLSFIVDQTEKYSSWLTEGLAPAPGSVSGASIPSSSVPTSPARSAQYDDGDFEPEKDESDDEETIEKEEEEAGVNEQENQNELNDLQRESEMPIEDLLKSLPPEVLEKPAPLEEEKPKEKSADKEKSDKEFRLSDADDEDMDVDDTIDEQEARERRINHKVELDDLEKEGEMSIEELRKKYAGAYESDFEAELSDLSTETEEEDSDDDDDDADDDETETEPEEETEEEEESDKEDEKEEGLGSLMDLGDKPKDEVKQVTVEAAGPSKDIQDIAATALSLQPTGYTLETTQVHTKVPFLLKHTLREYQHVGLNWLATINERRLNGILADEMGLGKTIQTIALLAHLVCEKGIWGPHLIVVPTSVMLNWEMEIKKWCPAFKILTYYGTQKERKQKRTGWTKTNAFHICITSYKLVVQDHQAFRRKKWKYFILDEAQNIKNFKSQRWQMLLNFSSQRRLLLTGTPLQNSLMELWSLMHFLMPNVFASHRDFKEWFSNPLTGMIEGSREYNESLIKRLHKVLRPFLLRRLKADVEKQMPKKYEHVVMCRLSKRQRFLYDEFMSQTKTKETLETGHFMSVINILMQLRKVCNHPNLFDPRPIVSPFHMEGLSYHTPSLVLRALEKEETSILDPDQCLANLELLLPAYAAHRIKKLRNSKHFIEEIDSFPSPPPRPQPLVKPKQLVFKSSLTATHQQSTSGRSSPLILGAQRPESPILTARSRTSTPTPESAVGSLQPASVHTSAAGAQDIRIATTVAGQAGAASGSSQSQPITLQVHQTNDGTRFMIPSNQLSQLPAGVIQIVQTSTGHHFITSSPSTQSVASTTKNVVNGPAVTSSTTVTSSTVQLPNSTQASSSGKPVLRVLPMSQQAATPEAEKPVQSRTQAKVVQEKIKRKSPLYMAGLAEKRAQRHQEKLQRIARINKQHTELRPVYGHDLCKAVDILRAATHSVCDTRSHDLTAWTNDGYLHCKELMENHQNVSAPRRFWKQTEALGDIINSQDKIMESMRDLLCRFTFAIPAVMSPGISLHASHPPPSMQASKEFRDFHLHRALTPAVAKLHHISSRMAVQFPEARLIEYDCGKLQTLDILLHRLKSGQHRVLIFTQMTRMLDVLEAFLNYHGHRYVRLDGTTRVEQRQALMDRFNMDKRIFVFILSTRSGGIGVNLTGADTVIFYDSDWNPTMDAQAQDRCHRIGQTRDVHIYRLISEMTVEENILKKANQKRLLGDVAIEGGNFTAAFFKQNTIKELFEEPSGLQSMVEESKPKVTPVPAVSAQNTEKEPEIVKPKLTLDQMEQALCQAEDDTDVQAAKVLKAEQKAELAEFDESIVWDEKEAEQKREEEQDISRIEQELAMLDKELTPVERYAVNYVELQIAPEVAEELEKAEEEVSLVKEEWELNRLKALKEEEERRAELEEDEMLYTYAQDETLNQVKKKAKALAAKQSRKSLPAKISPDSKRISSRIVDKRASVGDNTSDTDSGSPDSDNKKVASKVRVVSIKKALVGRRSDPGIVHKKITKGASPAVTKKLAVHIPKIPLGKRKANDSPSAATPKRAKFVPKKSITPKPVKPKLASPTPACVKKNVGSPLSPVPQPWSKPNLVIRTRKAANTPIIETKALNGHVSKQPISGSPAVSSVKIVPKVPQTLQRPSQTSLINQPQPILQVLAQSLQAQQSVIRNTGKQAVQLNLSAENNKRVLVRKAGVPIIVSNAMSSQLVQRTLVTQAGSPSKVHSTVPILEKMALQFATVQPNSAVQTSILQSSQAIISKPRLTSVQAVRPNIAVATSGAPGPTTLVRSQLTGVVRQIGKPTVAQLMAAQHGLAQVVGGPRPVLAQIVRRRPGAPLQPAKQVVQTRPQTVAQVAVPPRSQTLSFSQMLQRSQIRFPSQLVTQVIQPGAVTRPVFAIAQGQPQVHGSKTVVQQVIQGRTPAGRVVPGKQQYIVVANPDSSNSQSRIVILQPSQAATVSPIKVQVAQTTNPPTGPTPPDSKK